MDLNLLAKEISVEFTIMTTKINDFIRRHLLENRLLAGNWEAEPSFPLGHDPRVTLKLVRHFEFDEFDFIDTIYQYYRIPLSDKVELTYWDGDLKLEVVLDKESFEWLKSHGIVVITRHLDELIKESEGKLEKQQALSKLIKELKNE